MTGPKLFFLSNVVYFSSSPNPLMVMKESPSQGKPSSCIYKQYMFQCHQVFEHVIERAFIVYNSFDFDFDFDFAKKSSHWLGKGKWDYWIRCPQIILWGIIFYLLITRSANSVGCFNSMIVLQCKLYIATAYFWDKTGFEKTQSRLEIKKLSIVLFIVTKVTTRKRKIIHKIFFSPKMRS